MGKRGLCMLLALVLLGAPLRAAANNVQEPQPRGVQRSVRLHVSSAQHCKVYYSEKYSGAEFSDRITELKEGDTIAHNQVDGAYGVIIFTAPEDGYALSYVNASNSAGKYYTISNKTADGESGDFLKLESYYKNLISKANYTMDELRALVAEAYKVGCDSALIFTKSGQDTGDVESELSFYTQRLPTLQKKISSVRDGVSGEERDGESAGFGDVVTYDLDVTFYPVHQGTAISYSDVYITDALAGFGPDAPLAVTVPANAGKLSQAVTVNQQVSCTIGQEDVERGSITNEAQLQYRYKSEYSKGALSTTSSAQADLTVHASVQYQYESADGTDLPDGLVQLVPTDYTSYAEDNEVPVARHPVTEYPDETRRGVWVLDGTGNWQLPEGGTAAPGSEFLMPDHPVLFTAAWTFVPRTELELAKEGTLLQYEVDDREQVDYTADYTVTVTNTGGDTLYRLTLTDESFPPSAEEIACFADGAEVPAEAVTYDADAHTLTVALPGGLGPDQTLRISYTAHESQPLNENGILTVYSPVRAEGQGTCGQKDSREAELALPLTIYGRVIISPADIVIYASGAFVDDVEVVGGADGTVAEHTNLPEPGFFITLPPAAELELRKALGVTDRADLDLSPYLTFVDSADAVWGLELYDPDGQSQALDRYLYRLVPITEGQEPLRMQFYDGEKYIVDSSFDIRQALQQRYEMSIYPGYVKAGSVKAVLTVGDQELWSYDLGFSPGELIIRGTTTEQKTTAIGQAKIRPDQPVTQVTALADEDKTHYYINASRLEVDKPEAVNLLVDEVADTQRGEILKSFSREVVTDLYRGAALNYQFRYLDLVDTSMGNTWVTASAPLEIYWPYPDGVDQEDAFTIIHYRGMDRDYDMNEMDALVPGEDYTLEVFTTLEPGEDTDIVTYRSLQALEQGLFFEADGFSPYVLVWRQAEEPEDQDPGGSKPGTPAGGEPVLRTEEHTAYLIGRGGGGIQPLEPITRGETAMVLFRLLEEAQRRENWSDAVFYPDVPAESWCCSAVATMTDMGVLRGYGDGCFYPQRPVTRAEFAVMLARYFRLPEASSSPFPDVERADWFCSAVCAAAEQGWILGRKDGNFDPYALLTRAEAAVILNRALGRVPQEGMLLEREPSWVDNPPQAWYYEDMLEASVSHVFVWKQTEDGAVEQWVRCLEEPDWARIVSQPPDGAAGG